MVELYADLHWDSNVMSERMLALQARIVGRLNEKKTSPFYDRIVVTGKGKTYYRCLTQTTIADGLSQAQLLGSVKKKVFTPGPLAHHEPDQMDLSLSKASEILTKVFELFKSASPEVWELGDKPGGYLCTNIAVRSVFLVISDICNHIRFEEKSELSIDTADELFLKVKPYIAPVVRYFKQADAEQIQEFRRQGSSLDAVKKQSMGMNEIIRGSFDSYSPDGLDEYIESRNSEGHTQATLLIHEFQKRMFDYVIQTLKGHFGESNKKWWTEGIPYPVRKSCTDEWEKQKRVEDEEAYLLLRNYEAIAHANWDLLGSSFALGESDIGNRKKCTKWIEEMADLRNRTDHPEKETLTTEEVKSVEEIHEKVMKFFPESIEQDG